LRVGARLLVVVVVVDIAKTNHLKHSTVAENGTFQQYTWKCKTTHTSPLATLTFCPIFSANHGKYA
jgi:hypothetical protein